MRTLLRSLAALLLVAGSAAADDTPPPPPPPPPPEAAAPLPEPPAAAEPPAVAGPSIAFDREEHDFGVAGQEQELHAEFTVRNVGTEPLQGLKTLADCGCYGVTLSAVDLAPGATATLRVTFRTLMLTGPVTKRLSVRSNDPRRPDVTLRLKLLVAQGVVLDPGRVFFGDVLTGSLPSKDVFAKWLDGVGKPFQVLAVEVPGHAEDVQVTTSPHEEKQPLGRDKDGNAIEGTWKGTKVTFTFKRPPGLGLWSSTALIRTDHPDFPRLAVPLTANVSGRVWLQTRTVHFGYVRQGQTKRSSVAVRAFSKDVDLGKVTAVVRGGKVSAEVVREAQGPQAGWKLAVSVPADAALGKLDDVIELRTEVPGEEVTEIAVRGEVLPASR